MELPYTIRQRANDAMTKLRKDRAVVVSPDGTILEREMVSDGRGGQTLQTSWPVMIVATMPHCDQRILHAPGVCEYCDRHPEWQSLRDAWGIQFTDLEPDATHPVRCPADQAVLDGRRGDHHAWHGNFACAHG